MQYEIIIIMQQEHYYIIIHKIILSTFQLDFFYCLWKQFSLFSSIFLMETYLFNSIIEIEIFCYYLS